MLMLLVQIFLTASFWSMNSEVRKSQASTSWIYIKKKHELKHFPSLAHLNLCGNILQTVIIYVKQSFLKWNQRVSVSWSHTYSCFYTQITHNGTLEQEHIPEQLGFMVLDVDVIRAFPANFYFHTSEAAKEPLAASDKHAAKFGYLSKGFCCPLVITDVA